jgi:hypothetical protein
MWTHFEHARGEVKLKTRMMRKIAVLVTGSALALSFPVAGAIADSGGMPHSGSQGKGKQKQNGHHCPTWSKGKGVQVDRLPDKADSGQGKKSRCGFVFGGLSSI